MVLLPTSFSLYELVFFHASNLILIINTRMLTISCFVSTKINCWGKKKPVCKVALIPISVSLLMKKMKLLDWMLHHILCSFTGIVTAVWQQCAMFSFGEIPTFKKSRGGAERYRPYEHEFPSREYNLSSSHLIIYFWWCF